jgi:hypothetical protein
MVKNRFLVFVAIVLGLTMVTSAMVARTYAKYATEITAKATVKVASWKAVFQGVPGDPVTEETTFDFFDTITGDDVWEDTGVNSELLAPGTEGSFTLEYDTSGSETARNVKITIVGEADLKELEFLTFQVTGAPAGSKGVTEFDTQELTTGVGAVLLDYDFGPTDEGKGTITVNWEWPFETENGDAADTADGEAAISGDITITFTATQLDTYEED